MEVNGFREMLLQLGQLINSDELKTLKFFCKDIITTKVREKITSIVDLFEALEERGKLSSYNLGFLKNSLESTLPGRTDVLQVVEKYETEHLRKGALSPDGHTSPGHQSQKLKNEMHFLEEKLGKDYKFFLRYLGVPDLTIENAEIAHSKSIKEVIHQCMCEWLKLNETLQSEDLLKQVIAALKRLKRMDLVQRLEKGEY